MNLANLTSIIDSGADAIVRDVVGCRTEEYRQAEADAHSYVDASYTGQAGAYVTSWSAAKGWSDRQAADDILSTASEWRGAQAQLRTARLAHKERARSGEDAETVLADWLAFEKSLRASLGV